VSDCCGLSGADATLSCKHDAGPGNRLATRSWFTVRRIAKTFNARVLATDQIRNATGLAGTVKLRGNRKGTGPHAARLPPAETGH
jgi:hypothetical protein